MNSVALATIALLVESFAGYPATLQNRIGHPVQWMGWLITYLDDGLNDPEASATSNRLNGVLALIGLLLCSVLPAYGLARALALVPYGWILNILVATVFIAQKSLTDHVQAVADALLQSLSEARAAVSKIVGRDPNTLDESGVATAALETLAENASDGVVAPVLWYALLGLPGLVAYKAINTADSMIGHKSEKYVNFGWAAARLDDLVNLPASRLTGALFAIAAFTHGSEAVHRARNAMWRDANKHASPNAGWPEAAMAGALGLQLGGPRSYQGEMLALPTMGDGRKPSGATDIADGLSLFQNAMALLVLVGALMAIAL